jgi:hypothetical protein
VLSGNDGGRRYRSSTHRYLYSHLARIGKGVDSLSFHLLLIGTEVPSFVGFYEFQTVWDIFTSSLVKLSPFANSLFNVDHHNRP